MAETVAFAIGIYEAVKARAYYAQQEFLLRMAEIVGRENLWLLRPPQTRLTYPFCVNLVVKDMMRLEEEKGHKADWWLWMDDDVLPTPNGYEKLRRAADPKTRPHVAALGYSRCRPFQPSAVKFDGAGTPYVWADHPSSGTYPVAHTGMCLCLLHRSVFDIIPEPWFEIAVPHAPDPGCGPDVSLSVKLRQNGLDPHICFDEQVGHMGDGLIMNAKTLGSLRKCGFA